MSVVVLSGAGASGRSVLEVVRSAAPKLGIKVPTQVYGATERTAVELGSVLNEVADYIAREHEWQELKQEGVHVGPGTSFPLADDYLRMPKDSRLWSSRFDSPLTHIPQSDDWLRQKVTSRLPIGSWTIIGGSIEYNPALTSGETVRFYYLTRNHAVSGGVATNRFVSDDDTYRLDDRVLELMLIAEYKMRKGLGFEADAIKAQKALSQAISSDKGARMLTQRSRRVSGVPVAYPGVLG